ncbi:AIPR family protein [Nocardia brasiliensis]
MSYQQIEDGIVEGTNDGGIDAVYTFYNGNLVEIDSESGIGERPTIELELIQAKNERGFKELVFQKLIDHLPLLLQLDDDPTLRLEFNERVLERFAIFRSVFLKSSSKFPELTIRIRYVTKSVDSPNEKVQRKSARLRTRLVDDFRDARVDVDMIGAAELNNRARSRSTETLKLRVAEGPISAEKGGLICLVRLIDYYDFISDESHELRQGIFEENVRGYEGATVINRAIGSTLRQGDISSVDFWWLNNGVTILGRRVQPSGKTLAIEDPQIVNGLQTSKSIYQYFYDLRTPGKLAEDNGTQRNVLVRVVETGDEAISAQIIKATNSQNRVSLASLRATEPFQRDIEEYFARHQLYYERKKNTYKDRGKPRSSIVEVLELAQAVSSILLWEPHTARAKPSTLIRDPLYDKVFKRTSPLMAYVKCIQIMRRVDNYLEVHQNTMSRSDRSNIRYHLARASAAFALSSSRPVPKALAEVDVNTFDSKRLTPVFEWVVEARDVAQRSTGISDMNVLAKGAEWSKEMDRRLSRYTDKSRWPKKISENW